MNQKFSAVPLDLKQRAQWVLWRNVERDGKKTKLPFQPNGSAASSTDFKTWSSYKQAVESMGRFDGIGFVFDASDPFIGIDLDGCRDPETGKLEQWAKDVVVQLGAYAEVSPSKTGVKIFGSTGFRWPHKNKSELDLPELYGKSPGIEIYEQGRYFTVTGKRLQGMTDVLPVDEHFDWLADKFGMRREVASVSGESIRMETPVLERAAKYLAKMEPSISGQGGHNKCFAAACVLVIGFGLSHDEALSLLKQEYNPRCQPPWTDRELEHKVRSAAKQPGAKNYLRDSDPQEWSKIRLPGSYREHRVESVEQEPIPETRKTTLRKAANLYLSELASGHKQLIDTGIPDLDYAIGGGVALGEMVIVAGRPSHGKSAVALQMAHTMSENGLPVVLISEEMSALSLGKRAIQYVSNIPEEHWRTSVDNVASELDLHFKKRQEIHIVESCGTVDRACEEIESHVVEHGVKVAMVDYAQILQGKGRDQYTKTSQVSQALRMLAGRLQILVVVLAQLNREIEKRKQFVPMMSDIRETGQLEQDADVIVFGVWPHRIDSTKDASLYQFWVAKNRNRAIMKNAIECRFNPARQKLLEADIRCSPNYEDSFSSWGGPL